MDGALHTVRANRIRQSRFFPLHTGPEKSQAGSLRRIPPSAIISATHKQMQSQFVQPIKRPPEHYSAPNSHVAPATASSPHTQDFSLLTGMNTPTQ